MLNRYKLKADADMLRLLITFIAQIADKGTQRPQCVINPS